MRKIAAWEWVWAAGVSLGTALLIVAPFFWLGIASGHDFEFHAASWLDVAGQWKEGILFPRWMEWANHGFGEPRFIFYPPLSWLLGAGLGSVLPWNWVPIVYIVLAQGLAGLCAFALGRSVTAQGGALVGAACYAANPYALLVVYMRSDFAEQLGAAFYPLLLLLALRITGIAGKEKAPGSAASLKDSGAGGDIACFAVVFALVWLSNAPTGVIASYAMALVFAWAALRGKSLVPGIRGACGLALGLGLAAFYLVPAAYEQRWVSIEQALGSGYLPAQNFLFTTITDPEHTWFNWIASMVAIVLIVVTGIAALLSHQRMGPMNAEHNVGQQREGWNVVLLMATAATLLMLPVSNFLWSVLPKLRFLQFPWRWMCALAPCYAFFLAMAFGRIRRQWILLAAVAALSMGTAAKLIPQAWWDTEDLPTLRAAIVNSTGFDGTDEYDPRGDDHYDLPTKSPTSAVLSAADDDAEPPMAEVQVIAWTAREKKLTVISPQSARVALRLLDYPGWVVEVNGSKITPLHREGLAQMVIPVKPGTSQIRARFLQTPDRLAGDIISALSALVALGIWGWHRRGVGMGLETKSR